MKRIVVLDPISDEACRRLEQETGWTVEKRLGLTPEELPTKVDDADVLIVRSSTRVTAEVIEAARRLKVIGRAGIGVDNIDVEAASERGIRVVNTPGATTTSVAELTMAALLSLARSVPQADASLRRGEWRRADFQGFELKGKLLGLVGFGRIGREVARLAQAFGMRVVATDLFLEDSHVAGVPLHTLEDLLSRADFVSLHVPLDGESTNLLSRERMAMMKRGAYVLNLSRGGLVDEVALADMLDAGHLNGCVLDCYAEEPPGASLERLLSHPRTVLLPHLGASTREGQIRVGMELVDNVAKAVKKFMGDRAVRLAAEREAQEEAGASAGGEDAHA